MSIFSKINRIVTLRNGIRNRLVTFGLVNSSAKLEDCKTALEGIVDNTKKTSSYSYIQGAFHSGKVGSIFGKVGEGYCSANSVVSIPVPNLYPENIKKGVNIGGVAGLYSDYPGLNLRKIRSTSAPITFGCIYGDSATGSRYDGRKANFYLDSPIAGVDYNSYGLEDANAQRLNKLFVFTHITVTQGTLNDGSIISSPVTFYIKYSGSATSSTVVLKGISSLYSSRVDIEWGSRYIKYYSRSGSDQDVRGIGTLHYNEYEII